MVADWHVTLICAAVDEEEDEDEEACVLSQLHISVEEQSPTVAHPSSQSAMILHLHTSVISINDNTNDHGQAYHKT